MKTRLLLLAALLLAASCQRAPRVHQIKNLGNTPYQEDTIRVTGGILLLSQVEGRTVAGQQLFADLRHRYILLLA